jgi:H+-transporting ATPase
MQQNADPSSKSGETGGELADLPLKDLETRLGVTEEGLSGADAAKRLQQYGHNELVEKTESPLLRFLSYFWGPIPWMIEAAAVLSLFVKDWTDFVIIALLLIANAAVGFWEEHQAGNAIAALKSKLALKARVKRDGAWTSIAARELVPGDRIRLRIGEVVPADARLLDGDPLEVDQSALTGESLPVTRGPDEAVYSGAVIKRGEIDALVYATGAGTYFGRTAQLVQEARTVSHFQQAVLKVGDYLIFLAGGLVLLILSVALFRGDPFLQTLQFALILTVASVPVAMPTVLSVTMAVGARLLAAKEAVVSRLAAIEELAGMDVLCSDKTGTLTQNELTLGEPFCLSGASADEVIGSAALASREEDQDPIDLAVLSGLKPEQSAAAARVLHFQPFDPVQKRTEAKIEGPDGKTFQVAKGAPQVIQALAADGAGIEQDVQKAVNEFAARGFRSLGVARTDEEGRWRMLGVLPLYDPPRPDSKSTIATARQMGVRVKMVTGDQVAIAKEIASQLGLGTHIMDASVLSEAKHHEAGQLADTLESADGVAQVFPEHKYHIVEVLQQRGHITGMTGDGVNDAPALKKADAGIAVSGATDAARAAADIVLLTPGLSIIIDAIKESRKTFQRMHSYSIYRIAETIRVVLFMTLSILVFNFYPVTAIMIVLLALLNDGAILSIAYDRVKYSDEPEVWNMPVVLGVATSLGIMGVIETFGLFYIAERYLHIDREIIQSLIYLKLSVSGQLTIFVTRTRGRFWSIAPAPLLLWAVVGTQVLATLIAVFGVLMPALGWTYAGLVWVYALVWFVIEDQVKLAAYRAFDHAKPGLLSKRVAA